MRLLQAELRLTMNIVFGLVAGELLLSSGIMDRLFAPLVPRLERWGVHREVAGAMLVAMGSSRLAAGMLSAAQDDGGITRREATFGTLSLAFPAYLRRWVVTVTVAAGIAGPAGLIYAAVLLVRSGLRFVWAIWLLRRCSPTRGTGSGGEKTSVPDPVRAVPEANRGPRFGRLPGLLRRSLPWAWGFFALTYALLPQIEYLFTHHVARGGFLRFLPPEGWAVSVSALAHATAALASAAAAMKAGDLDVSHAVLALLVGNLVGTLTRTMRQNVGYWMGIFPREMVPGLVRWHLGTLLPLEIASIFLAWLAAAV